MKTSRNRAIAMAALAITTATAADATPKYPVSFEIGVAKPYFNEKGEHMVMSLLNVELSDVRIKVIDNSGRVLYREDIEGEVVIEKAFNFENAYEGEYRIVVEQGDERFIKKIKVNS